jgi:hypothetical protein
MVSRNSQRYIDDSSNKDINMYYKAVSASQSISNAYSTRRTNTGRSLKPYAVSHVSKIKNGNDIEVKWLRRSRFSSELKDGIDIPLGESSEKYEVELYNDDFTVLKRLHITGVSNFIYTEAQQMADFGALQTNLYAKIYQVSEKVGRGFEYKGML